MSDIELYQCIYDELTWTTIKGVEVDKKHAERIAKNIMLTIDSYRKLRRA